MARQRQLPQNLDAERQLLGAILAANDALYDIGSILVKGDFYEPANGEIFAILKDHIEAGRTATPVTILHDMSQNADIGGITASEYLTRLYHEGAPRALTKELALGIRDLALRRRIIEAGEQMINEAFFTGVSVKGETIRDKYDAAFSALFATTGDIGIRSLYEYGHGLVDQMAIAYRDDQSLGLQLGLKGVQDLTGPLLADTLVILAGAPGSGKSALAQQVGEYVAALPDKDGAPRVVLMFSAEMGGVQVAGRAVSAATGISASRLRRGNVNEVEFDNVIAELRKREGLKFLIDAHKSPSANSIRAKAHRIKRLLGRLDLVIVDHLRYMEPPQRGMSDIDAAKPNMQALKAMSGDLAVPVIAIAQLKGTFNAGPVRRPVLGDLWNDAVIEQNADIVAFVHRPEYMLGRREPTPGTDDYTEWQNNMAKWHGVAEIILGKNRDDAGFGVRTMYFNGPTMRFDDNEARRHFANDGPTLLDYQPGRG